MANRPLTVKRGDTWIFTAKWRDSTGAPIDLDGCSVRQWVTLEGSLAAVLELGTATNEITIVETTSLGTVAALINLPAAPRLSDVWTVTAETADYIYTTSGWVELADGTLCDTYTRVEAVDMAALIPGDYEFDQEITFIDNRVLSTDTIQLIVLEDKTI